MVEGSWGWNCQARCVPDVDAEDGLRRRQTIDSGQTLKTTAERKRRSEWGSRGFQWYWTWLLVPTADLLESSPHNNRLQSLRRMEKKKKNNVSNSCLQSIFWAHHSITSHRCNTAARRATCKAELINCLQSVNCISDLLPVYSALAEKVSSNIFSVAFPPFLKNRYDGSPLTKAKWESLTLQRQTKPTRVVGKTRCPFVSDKTPLLFLSFFF